MAGDRTPIFPALKVHLNILLQFSNILQNLQINTVINKQHNKGIVKTLWCLNLPEAQMEENRVVFYDIGLSLYCVCFKEMWPRDKWSLLYSDFLMSFCHDACKPENSTDNESCFIFLVLPQWPREPPCIKIFYLCFCVFLIIGFSIFFWDLINNDLVKAHVF